MMNDNGGNRSMKCCSVRKARDSVIEMESGTLESGIWKSALSIIAANNVQNCRSLSHSTCASTDVVQLCKSLLKHWTVVCRCCIYTPTNVSKNTPKQCSSYKCIPHVNVEVRTPSSPSVNQCVTMETRMQPCGRRGVSLLVANNIVYVLLKVQ